MKPFNMNIITAGVLLTLVAGLVFCSPRQQKSVLFLSGAGMKVPVNEIAEAFEKETGIRVQTQFGGSSILRDYILSSKTGGLFLPGDKKNLEALIEKKLVITSSFMAWHVVAILVSPEAKDRIKSLDDLAREGVRIAMSNPELASLGRIVMKNVINKHPKREQILNNIVVYGSSTQDVLNLYRQGNIDAIIEWDVMAATPEGKGVVVVPLAEPYQVKDELHVGLLTTARYPDAARKLYEFMLNEGKEIFKKHGYNTLSMTNDH